MRNFYVGFYDANFSEDVVAVNARYAVKPNAMKQVGDTHVIDGNAPFLKSTFSQGFRQGVDG